MIQLGIKFFELALVADEAVHACEFGLPFLLVCEK
jgi:hypothetical protein